MIRTTILATMVSTILATPSYADVYRYRDTNGRVWLTNHTVDVGVAAKASVVEPTKQVVKPVATQFDKRPLTRWEINHYVHKAAIKYGVDEKLVHAVIKTESTYRKAAVSKKGAAGLMQLMPATAQRFGVADRMDEKQNIDGGVKFLRFLLDTFKDPKLAVAGYNAGEHAVIRHNNRIPPYPETQNYVGLVMAAYNE